MSTAEEVGGVVQEGLYSWRDARDVWLNYVADPEVIFVGHHIAFDHGVLAAEWPDLLPIIFQLYRDGRVRDTMLRQKLIDNAKGNLGGFRTDTGVFIKLKYGLADLTKRHLKVQLDKDTWRLRYGQLRDVPLDQWEPGARDYAIQDAVSTLRVAQKQEEVNQAQGLGAWLVDEARQAKAAWAIQLMSAWGIRTDPSKVDKLIVETEAAYQELLTFLQDPRYGFVRADGSRDTKRVKGYMEAVMGGRDKCNLTDTGEISLDEAACTASDDPLLLAYTELSQLKNVLSKDVPALRRGVKFPIHSRFDTLLATGRTSSSNPNIQNVRRLPGIRECFVPVLGDVFVSADYQTMELHCWAEVCFSMFGFSDMAEAINAGVDPHLDLASHIMGIPYAEALRRKTEKAVKEMRQLAKALSFGLPGGLGAESFVAYAKGTYGVTVTADEARDLKENAWMARWREAGLYLKAVGDAFRSDHDGEGLPVVTLYSDRVRGKCSFCAAANTPFQALCADVVKEAMFRVSEACYVDRNSPLYGSRIVNMVHDEINISCKEAVGHEAAMELARLMERAGDPWLPHCPAVVDQPVVSRYWSKESKPVWRDGRLVPWPAAA